MSSEITSPSTDKNSEFGSRLKEAFNNSSNQAIAEKLRVSNPALTAYMQGRIPPADKLIEITRLTRCNLNWLLTGEGTKKNTPQIERPQGIIVQGSKGGIGTSLSAAFIASNLALKGYGVLVVADVLHTCEHLFLANREPVSKQISDLRGEVYISTRRKNLDLFLPEFWKKDHPEEFVKRFNFDYSGVNKRYQFVIFDVQRMENPFDYPHSSLATISALEPILRNAKVLVTYQPLVSFTKQVESTLRYIELQKKIYPDAEFLGAFIINRWKRTRIEKLDFTEAVDKLKAAVGSKLFDTEVEYHKQLNAGYEELERMLFSRKTNMFHNFSQLVNEILQKLDLNNKVNKK